MNKKFLNTVVVISVAALGAQLGDSTFSQQAFAQMRGAKPKIKAPSNPSGRYSSETLKGSMGRKATVTRSGAGTTRTETNRFGRTKMTETNNGKTGTAQVISQEKKSFFKGNTTITKQNGVTTETKKGWFSNTKTVTNADGSKVVEKQGKFPWSKKTTVSMDKDSRVTEINKTRNLFGRQSSSNTKVEYNGDRATVFKSQKGLFGKEKATQAAFDKKDDVFKKGSVDSGRFKLNAKGSSDISVIQGNKAIRTERIAGAERVTKVQQIRGADGKTTLKSSQKSYSVSDDGKKTLDSKIKAQAQYSADGKMLSRSKTVSARNEKGSMEKKGKLVESFDADGKRTSMKIKDYNVTLEDGSVAKSRVRTAESGGFTQAKKDFREIGRGALGSNSGSRAFMERDDAQMRRGEDNTFVERSGARNMAGSESAASEAKSKKAAAKATPSARPEGEDEAGASRVPNASAKARPSGRPEAGEEAGAGGVPNAAGSSGAAEGVGDKAAAARAKLAQLQQASRDATNKAATGAGRIPVQKQFNEELKAKAGTLRKAPTERPALGSGESSALRSSAAEAEARSKARIAKAKEEAEAKAAAQPKPSSKPLAAVEEVVPSPADTKKLLEEKLKFRRGSGTSTGSGEDPANSGRTSPVGNGGGAALGGGLVGGK